MPDEEAAVAGHLAVYSGRRIDLAVRAYTAKEVGVGEDLTPLEDLDVAAMPAHRQTAERHIDAGYAPEYSSPARTAWCHRQDSMTWVDVALATDRRQDCKPAFHCCAPCRISYDMLRRSWSGKDRVRIASPANICCYKDTVLDCEYVLGFRHGCNGIGGLPDTYDNWLCSRRGEYEV